ncbi:MAG TPA: DUF3048 domain-containing protein [Mycobacteriales bacterium]|jgi:hypothetical protein|nr:DUF3048 domain-containing protein [Mycobacteriales bacterium]HVU61614.1 DUF3048 domain-containing protein [Mycobacteriales bacterium]
MTALLAVGTLAVAGCSSGSSSSTSSLPKPATSNEASAGPVCPLTGLPQAHGQRADRVALAVKIDNIAPALPQSGLNRADVVFEELVEGGLTRLMAIFQCDKAPEVGPIRSARISDADLLALLHGSVLGYSGANAKDMPPIYAHSGAALIAYDNQPQFFRLSSSRPAPHNVFSSTRTLLNAGLALKPKLDAPPPMFTYGPADPLGRHAKRVYMSWPAASAQWTWSKGSWLRTQGGRPDLLTSGQQVSATNVVILRVNIASTGLRDVLGSPSPLDVTTGSNRVWVLRDGKMTRGTWTRHTRDDEFSLADGQGHPIALAPGRTWVELLPTPRKPSRH